MSETKLTLGQAIDRILEALQSIDESARPTILATVSAHLGIPLGITGAIKPSGVTETYLPQPLQTPQVAVASKNQAVDIRTLKGQKQPKSAVQMACLVAYYLQDIAPDIEKKDAISVADLERFFKQAGFQLPKRLSQLPIDAKSSGYFESIGKGLYKLSAVGYNLVVHNLPSSKSE